MGGQTPSSHHAGSWRFPPTFTGCWPHPPAHLGRQEVLEGTDESAPGRPVEGGWFGAVARTDKV